MDECRELGCLPDIEVEEELVEIENRSTIHTRWEKSNINGVLAYTTDYFGFLLIRPDELDRLSKVQDEIQEFREEILKLQNKLENYVRSSRSSSDALSRKKRLRQRQVLELYSQDKSVKEIIEETGFSKTSVYDYIKEGSELLSEIIKEKEYKEAKENSSKW